MERAKKFPWGRNAIVGIITIIVPVNAITHNYNERGGIDKSINKYIITSNYKPDENAMNFDKSRHNNNNNDTKSQQRECVTQPINHVIACEYACSDKCNQFEVKKNAKKIDNHKKSLCWECMCVLYTSRVKEREN